MKKIFTMLFSLCLVALTANATVVKVDSVHHFFPKYNAAVDGDTLLVFSGTYSGHIQLPCNKAVTIWAPDTCEAIFTGSLMANDDANVEGGSLSFIGIIVDGPSYYVNYSAPGHMKLLSWEKCEIRNISRCFAYFNQNDDNTLISSVETLKISDCYVHDCNTGNWNMMWCKAPIYNLIIEESTFTKNDGVESFYLPRATYEGSHHFTFKHNTVYQGSRDANRAICNVGASFQGEESTFEFEDNIIVCPEGKVAGRILNAEMGSLSMKNNLIVGYQPVLLKTALDSIVENPYTLEELELASIAEIFPDPANANFTIYSASKLATASTTAGVLGDSQWLKEAGMLYTLTTGLAEGVAPEAGSISGPSGKMEAGQSVTLTANKGYGYKFVKWVDQTNQELSTEVSYTFEISADTYVYAVFEAIPLYKLEVATVGGGIVKISKPGKDGGYEYYEEGTELTLTAVSNIITEFIMWEDFSGDISRDIVINADTKVEAQFHTIDYVVGWDFDTNKSTASQMRPADFVGPAVDQNDVPILSMYYTRTYQADPTPFSGWWNRTESDRPAATFWKYYSEDGTSNSPDRITGESFFMQTRISTKGYSDVVVAYSMKYAYYGYNTWKLLYSYNNLSWETAGSHNITGSWQDFRDTIPNTGDKETLYLRWIGDVESQTHNDIKDVDGTYFTDLFVLADVTASLGKAAKSQIEVAVKDNMLNVSNIEGEQEVKLLSVDGRVLRQTTANHSLQWNVSSFRGLHILCVGDQVVKVNF